MANRQKEKGKGVEREFAKIFTEVFESNFQRVPNSGAFIGGKNVERISQLTTNQTNLFKGDIIPPDHLSNLILECKGRKTFAFNLLFDDNKELNSWIEQVEVDYKAVNEKGLYFILIKINNLGYFVCYRMTEHITAANTMIYKYNDKPYVIQRFSKEWLISNKNYILEKSK